MEKKINHRWVDVHFLVSAFPVFRKIDAVYAFKEEEKISIERGAIIGIQLYKTTSKKYSLDTGSLLDEEKHPEINYCYLTAPDDDEFTEIGPNPTDNIIGYDIEGETRTEQMWLERARKFFLRKEEEKIIRERERNALKDKKESEGRKE
jgi:hypothetical protein